MSSLIPQERGFLWSIDDVIHGNKEKDRKPVQTFINEVNRYPGLLEIIQYIEGMICRRGIHASGVILYGEDPFETASFMKAPNGNLTTCYDLHRAEAAGDTKYDFLVTEISDKIIKCFELLQKDREIETNLSIREIYNKYIHPEVVDTTNEKLWEHLSKGDILDVFQFSTGVGLAIAKKLKPKNPMEMTAANAMMRLMSEKDKEPQQDRYIRIQQQGLEVFDKEMTNSNFTLEQKSLMHKHCDKYWGCCALQEQMMELLMDVAGFTLGEANTARKIVGKKQMNKIPELKEKVYGNFNDIKVANYFWENIIAPQLGYAFSLNHSLPYSFVGIQTILIATKWNPIYWNTACLIVNSGSLEDEDSQKNTSTNYEKIAKAIGDIQKAGIKISLVDINKSDFGFKPDVENNQILFGLKGMLNINDDLVKEIISNRPYVSPRDFLNKVRPKKQAMISLIKGGAFDNMLDRKLCMGWYLWEVCDKKNRLTLQNMGGLIKYDLIPEKLTLSRRVFEFNRYLKSISKGQKGIYLVDERALNFLQEIGCDDLVNIDNTSWSMKVKEWEKEYQNYMDNIRSWLNVNQKEILEKLNSLIFKDYWNQYAQGNISAWEMEVLCFYYHDHELKDVNMNKYGFSDFLTIPSEPEVERSFIAKTGHEVKIFKLYKIFGTCIAKNKTKSTVSLLTPSGVVNVKFRKEYFSLFDKQISERQPDGSKKVVDESWFNRGEMIVVQGIRSEDNFITKKYSTTPGHQLYKIKKVLDNGNIELTATRVAGDIEEDV